MKANTIALSALTLATVTVALPMVSQVDQDVSDSASSRLEARQFSLLPSSSSGLNLGGLLQPAGGLTSGLTGGLTNNLLGGLGSAPGGLPQTQLLSALNALNPVAGILASTLGNILGLPLALLSGNPLNPLQGITSALNPLQGLTGALGGVTAALPLGDGVPDVLSGVTAGLPAALDPLSNLLPGVLSGIGGILPTGAANPLGGLLTGLPGLGAAVPTRAGAVTPVSIPTTLLQQVSALVPSTITTQVPTVVPTRVVQAVPTNILGLLQPLLPPVNTRT